MKYKTALILVPLIFIAAPLVAHQMNTSYTTITVTDRQIEIMFTFDLNDLENNFALDANGDGQTARDEMMRAMPDMYQYFAGHFTLALGYTPVELEQQEGRFTQDDFGNIFINFFFKRTLSESATEIGFSVDFFDKFGGKHNNLAKMVHGENVQQAIFTIDQPRERFVIGGEMSLFAQLREFTYLGIEHIFLGYDHIMFLLGLIIIGGRLIDLVKIVTSFTIAHSITLILAALQVVSLPARLIESGIALSIAYVAAENFLILSDRTEATKASALKHRWILTFCFGLVHGFGFANVLRDLGLPAKGLIGSLLAFNLGVEIGQIAIVGLLFPIILWSTRTKMQRQLIYAFSSIILIFGLSWFVERAFALHFMPF
ncbi:MAG: DUF6702 family protein [bacterium]